MNSFTPVDLDLTFPEEGICAQDFIEQRINESSMLGSKDTFYVADLGDVLQKHLRWVRPMPRVIPFYAIKRNDSRAVVMTFATLGTGFDCSAKAEIQLVKSLRVDSCRITYTNPCNHMKYASAHRVQMMMTR
ncbi:ornithine decarboxylase-like [Conger conger]|uniref:ornithine decarboxylase-like n=1 Tax=Conger conger TaxID=82655 RepID=UPI002A5ADA82|nr:ornithine decarboxylase-like [Conger conger]